MMQDRLFFEDWREALRHVVAAMGGPKVVGARMRQDMKPDHAGRWISHCLNSDRREHFSPDHLFSCCAWRARRGCTRARAWSRW